MSETKPTLTDFLRNKVYAISGLLSLENAKLAVEEWLKYEREQYTESSMPLNQRVLVGTYVTHLIEQLNYQQEEESKQDE